MVVISSYQFVSKMRLQFFSTSIDRTFVCAGDLLLGPSCPKDRRRLRRQAPPPPCSTAPNITCREKGPEHHPVGNAGSSSVARIQSPHPHILSPFILRPQTCNHCIGRKRMFLRMRNLTKNLIHTRTRRGEFDS